MDLTIQSAFSVEHKRDLCLSAGGDFASLAGVFLLEGACQSRSYNTRRELSQEIHTQHSYVACIFSLDRRFLFDYVLLNDSVNIVSTN